MPMDDRPPAEQVFFADPAVDRLMGMVMTLAAEVWVLRDRLRALEVLAAAGALKPGALDGYVPGETEAAAIARDREAFVRDLMSNVLGEQVSRGAPNDLMTRFADRPRGV